MKLTSHLKINFGTLPTGQTVDASTCIAGGDNIIFEDKRYNTNPGTYCLSNCICNYLNYVGLDITELDILMDHEFQIVYTEGSSYIPMLSEGIENTVWNYLRKNNIEVEKRSNDQDARLWLSDSIKNDSLIVGHLNNKNLIYYSRFADNKINNSKHFVNLIGINDINGIYISDGYIPTYPVRTFEGWIKLEDNDESNHFYKINRDQLIKLPYSTEKTVHTLTTYREKLFKILGSFLEGGRKGGDYYGYSAYEKCILDLTNIRHHRIQSYQELFYCMTFHLTAGGVITSKRLIKSYLNKLSLYKHVAVIEKIIRKFELLKLLLLKCSVDFQDDYVLDVQNKLMEILQDEVDLYRFILEHEHNKI
ncbi:hypothetical protein CON32_23525 [Bacillus cereus]|nr:hypothetical protein CON32_23525 [Bacillus cereus]